MNIKGNTKRIEMKNFWKGHEERVSNELKEMVFEQYLSYQNLYIYCDSSRRIDYKQMSLACTFVSNSTVRVKSKYVYLPKDCINKNIYGEIKAVIFALRNFRRYLTQTCENVIIYSDVADIEKLITKEITFKKNPSLKNLQAEMITLYEEVKKDTEVDIDVKYLTLIQKKYNPFQMASHNEANRLLSKMRNNIINKPPKGDVVVATLSSPSQNV